MDALAGKWFLSGTRSEDLYKGKTDEIIKALKAWVVVRNARNEANLMLPWDFFAANDAIFGLRNQGSLHCSIQSQIREKCRARQG